MKTGCSVKYKNKNSSVGHDVLPDLKTELIPKHLFYFLILVSLTLPNLIFSGSGWFDTLHIMKWTFAMVPVALISLIFGFMLAIYGPERLSFKIDLFGWIWLLLLGYISVQPLWLDISSWSTYSKEWFFFASLAAVYILCYNLFRDSGCHKLALWLANINAAVNVIFAELLIRDMNAPFPFIMNVPGNYIGNTGQQEMFGLWMAMAVMNGIYLHMACKCGEHPTKTENAARISNLIILALNAWGMWNSTTRGGILALFTGTAVISIIIFQIGDRRNLRKIAQAVAIVFFVLGMNLTLSSMGLGRALGPMGLIEKTTSMSEIATVGKRTDIWQTSCAVIMEHPIKGVGIGQFKWHYLEGQRLAMQKNPELKWQFTYWAHSEYIQWFAEFGIFGAIVFLAAGFWWIWSFFKALAGKKKLSSEAMWGCSMIFLICFDAIFSRPFHRIEDVIWLSLAFAIVNRELLPVSFEWSEIRHSSIYRMLGAFMAVISIAGLVFLSTGLRGDQYLRSALQTNNAAVQEYRIQQALRMPMTRDEAEEQYAYHLMAVARVTRKPEDWSKAINQLYKSFTIRPQAKQLLELINVAQQTNNQALLKELVKYLKPGSYKIVPKRNISAP